MSFLKDLSAGTVSGLFEGVGNLAKDLRQAISGDISSEKKAEIELKFAELEANIENSRLSVMIAEASSQDKWTSRARPTFLYVVYALILASLPMGILFSISPETAGNIVMGFKNWLEAIPDKFVDLFETVLLGYIVARSADKGIKQFKSKSN